MFILKAYNENGSTFEQLFKSKDGALQKEAFLKKYGWTTEITYAHAFPKNEA